MSANHDDELLRQFEDCSLPLEASSVTACTSKSHSCICADTRCWTSLRRFPAALNALR